ncbi:gliding motility-associated C-terminal domain-containing protein [Chitinophaga defluvii]|uniref:Gliding motility-associated C-terminal domain-containing protein n=1 Tax=Chitinophaga defluvii TaxID=3163343 RepID=A0ABV2TB24_9BACT
MYQNVTPKGLLRTLFVILSLPFLLLSKAIANYLKIVERRVISIPAKAIGMLIAVIALLTIGNLQSQAQLRATQRVYANAEQHGIIVLGAVNDQAKAVDGNLNTYATLAPVILGGAWLQFKFTGATPGAGDSIHIRMGSTVDLLSLLGGISIQAYKGNTPVAGTSRTISSLLTLIAGASDFDLVYKPASGLTYGVDYDAVRVTTTGVAIGGGLRLYEAYFDKAAAGAIACDAPADLLSGSTGSIAGGLNPVDNAQQAIDGNPSTFATLRANVSAVNNKTFVTVLYPSYSTPGDSVRILFKNPGGGLLDANVLGTSLSVTTYNNNTLNGTLALTQSLLNLRLLPGSVDVQMLTFPINQSFNRIEVSLGGGLATALQSLEVYEVLRVAPKPVLQGLANDTLLTCNSIAPVTLKVNNPKAGETYTWYTSAAGASVASGTQYTTGTLTAGINKFYVAVSRNGCTNTASERREITVIANNGPVPAPVVASSFAIATGQSLTLSAQPSAGATIVWYTDTTAAPVFTGADYQVGPFNTPGTYKYFAGSRLGSGCESSRAMVTVTVTGPVTPGTDCNIPTAQSAGTTLGCVLCAITDPTNAIDNNPNNFTHLSMPVGLLGGSVFQQLIFPAKGAATDSIRITLGSPGGLADVSLLGGVEIKIVDGTTVRATYTVSDLLTLRLLTGNKYTVTVPAAGTFNLVQIKLTGVANLINNLDVYGARIISPAPTAITNNLTICPGQTATLSATPAAGTSLRWYDANRAMVSSQNSFTTPALNTPGANKYYLLVIGANSCANPDTIPVTVMVNAKATAADIIASDTSVCIGNLAVVTPTAPAVTGTKVFKWYKDAAATQPITNGLVEGSVHYAIDPATGKLSVIGLPAGTVPYYVSVSGDNRCENAANTLKLVNVTVTSTPAPPVVAPSFTISTGQTVVLNAQQPAGATIVWYTDTTAAAVFTGANYQVGPFNTPGTYKFFAGVKLAGGCESTRSLVTVIVTGPVTPGPDCNVPNNQLSGTTLGCVLCSINNPTNSIDSDPNNFTRLSLPAGLLGGAVYQQLFFGTPGAATDSIRLTFASPGGLADVSLLGGVEIKVLDGTTVRSTHVLSNLLTLRLLSGDKYVATIPAGGAFNMVQIKLTGVLNLLNNLDIYGARIISPVPTAITNNVTVCQGQTASLSATPAAGTTLRWYDANRAMVSNQNSFTTAALNTPGVNTFYLLVIGTNNCANPDTIPVSVNVNALGTPADVNIADTFTVCGGANAELTPTAPNVTGTPVFKWYRDANKTQAITNGLVNAGITYTLDANGKLTVAGVGATALTVYVSVSGDNRCENAAGNLKKVTINTTTGATPPVVAGNVVTSPGQQVILQATSTGGATIVWYSDNVTPTPAFTGNNYTVGPFAASTVHTYYVAAKLPGGCESVRVPVTVTVTNTVPPGTDCNTANGQQSGTTLGCVLCAVTNPTNSIDSDPNNFTSLTMPVGLLGGSVYQQLTFPAPGVATDSIRLIMNAPGGLADVGLLAGTEVKVFNGSTVVSTHVLSSVLTLRLLSGQQYMVTVPAGGAFTGVQVKLTGTLNALSSLDIYGARIIAPNPTAITKNVTTCAGLPVELSATLSAGTTAKWYTDSTGTTLLSSLPAFKTDTFKTAGIFTYYLQVIGTNNCPNPDRIPVKITVTAKATPADITVADADICGSGDAVLTPTAPGVTTPVFSWYKDAAKTKLITNGLTDPGGVTYTVASNGALTVSGLGIGTTTYYVSVSGTNKCDNAPDDLKAAVVKVATGPVVPVVTGDVVAATGQQVTLTASAADTVVWFADATTMVEAGRGLSFAVGPFTNPGTYTYYAAAKGAGSCYSGRVPVRITITGPVIPQDGCNVPTSQLSGTTLGCVLCSIDNPTFAIDKDTTNFTRLSMPVGLLGGSIYQQLIFPTTGTATDSIRLFLGSSVGLADVGLLAGVEIAVFNGTTLVKKDTLSKLLNLRLLGGNQYVVTIPAKGAYNGVQVKLTGTANLLTSLDIYGARVIYPNPTVDTKDVTTCVGTKATLKVTPAAGSNTTVKWYADATSKVVLGNQPTYTTDTLKVAGTVTYYVEVVGANGCPNPDRIPVKVVVTPAPAVPAVQSDNVTICAGSDVVLAIANPDQHLKYNWYATMTGGTKLNADSGRTYKVLKVNTDTTYYVEAVSDCGAASVRKAVHIAIGSSLGAPTVTPSPASVVIGQQAILTAKATVGNAILVWYGSQSGTDSLFTGAIFAAPAQPAVGTKTYWVEARLSGSNTCNSARTAVNVNTVAGDNQTVPCEGATTQTVGSSGLLVLGNVYNPALAVDNLSNTGASMVIDLGLLNAAVWEKAGFNGVSSPGDTVRVLLENPSQVLSAAVLASVQLTTYQGNTAGDSILVSNPVLSLKLLNNGRQALVEFVPTKPFDAVEVKLKSGVAGALTAINFNYAQRAMIAPKVEAAKVEICAGGTATLKVLNPVAGITYRWYNAAGVYQTGKDGASFTTSTLNASTSYAVEAYRTTSGCASAVKAQVAVNVLPVPAAPTVLSTSVQVCAGSDAVLAVTNPVKGLSYSWFNVPAGGTKLNTDSGFTYKVINVTAPATYYVAAVNDSCKTVSATRTAVLVTPSSGLLAPTVTPSPDTVGIGEQSVLTAKAAVANVTFNWFASANGTDTLFKGAVYATAAQQTAGTKTYWVEAVLNGGTGCKSARTAVNVVTRKVSPAPIPCEAGSSQSVGGSGLLVLGNVYNPQLVIDDNANTGSSLVIDLGVLNASVWQRVGFNGTSTPNDTVRVMLENPGQVLSAALLASVQLTTYQGTTPGDSLLVSNPAVHLKLLNGNKQALVEFVPTKQFNMVEVKLKSGVAGALTAINFNYAQRAIAQPKVQAANASVCAGKSVVISVQNPVPGITYQWFNSQGNKLIDSVAYIVPGTLSQGTHNYFVTASRNGCASASAKVQVTVLAAPIPPTPAAGNPSVTCLNTPVTLKVNTVAGVTYNWYDAPTGGAKIVTNNSSYTTLADLAEGTYNYYVEGVNAGDCGSGARTKITLTVSGGSTAADINAADQTICNGDDAVLTPTSTTVSNAIFKWYAKADRTSPITVGVDGKGVLTVKGLTTGIYTYYVSVSGVNACENVPNALKAVKVIVTSPAVAADITAADQSICEGSSATLTPTSTTVTNPVFKWYGKADKTAPITTGVDAKGVLTVTGLASGTYTYYVSVTGTNKCENAAGTLKAVKVTVGESSTAADITAADRTVCVGSSAVLTPTSATVTNPVFKWYAKADKTDPITSGVDSKGVLTINGLAAGTYTYYVSVSGSNKCENAAGALKAVMVTVTASSTANDVTIANQVICEGTDAVLVPTSTTVTNPIFKWYANADKTNPIITNVDAKGILTVSGLTGGTYTYYVSVSGSNKCENVAGSLKAVQVKVNTGAQPGDVTVDNQGGCVGDDVVLTPRSGLTAPTFQWFANSNRTTPITLGVDGNGVLTIKGLAAGSYTYYVSVSSTDRCGGASGPLKAVNVKVNEYATAADIKAADAEVCAGRQATLTASSTTVTNPSFTWYTDAALTKPVAFTATYTTSPLSAATQYYVTVKGDNKCANKPGTAKVVSVSVNPSPLAPASVLVPNPVCAGTTATLTVENPDAKLTYRWYDVATGGTSLGEGNTYTTNVLNATTVYYVESVMKDGGCISLTRTAAQVIVQVPLATPVVTAGTTTATSVTFNWTAVPGAIRYEVTLDNGTTFIAPSSGANGTSHTITGLGPNQSVSIRVRAVGNTTCETSALSAAVTGKTSNPQGNNIFVPNLFSPNGDGANDVLLVYSTAIAQMEFRVYNQWGQLVFTSKDQRQGWDGTMGGQKQPVGVYVYALRATMQDGTVVNKRGNVTLLR